MEGCIFCQIAVKKIPADIVYEDKEILVFRDISPQAPVHLLAIPKKHISSILEIDRYNQGIIGRLYLLIRQLMEKEPQAANGFRVVANSGPDAGQAVIHIHFHVLAGRRFSWPPG